MKIEAGKRYVRRDGTITSELYWNDNVRAYVDTNTNRLYSSEGLIIGIIREPGILYGFDLIGEYKEQKQMKKVIRIPGVSEEETKNTVEFTHYLDPQNGWEVTYVNPTDSGISRVVYLGNCADNGDLFAVYMGKMIIIYKGHLNSGEY